MTIDVVRRLLRALIGKPLDTKEIPHQSISKVVGLAVFASDALSSTAYATEEILVVLALAGAGALSLSFPLALAIAGLLVLVTISYEQTIHAYPGGGGAYIVARDNLGEVPAQVAGAALLTDYVLTVAVSISNGVAQLASAVPMIFPYRTALAVALIGAMMLINLRGVRESGRALAIPTYFFLAMAGLTVGAGLFQALRGTLGSVTGVDPIPVTVLQPLTLFLILRAFSSGSTALTGIEAISNGIPSFREPRSRNAGITLLWMSAILTSVFVCITYLANEVHAFPSESETIISQITRTVFSGTGWPYILMMGGTTLILIMAANTSFAGFPRLGALQAADGFLPRQLTARGSRLVFSRGIVTLAFFASVLVVIFQAETNALIPLYAIGVFLSFTLSQAGMAVRFGRVGRLQPGQEIRERHTVLAHDPRWRIKQVISMVGAFVTGVVMVVFAVTKFAQGAWIVVLLIPCLVLLFLRIHHHYLDVASQLSLDRPPRTRSVQRHRVIIPIANVHQGVLQALQYCRSLSADVTAVHVAIDPEEGRAVREKWDRWGDGTRLVVIDSPYRDTIRPLIDYIENIEDQLGPHDILTIVMPHFVPSRWWHSFLHNQTALAIRLAFLFRKGTVVADVPYRLSD
ncbi:MAG: APC family permease [Anaerolineales bacterium]